MRLQTPGSSERVSLPIEIAVRDNGPGIPDEFISEMFDPFVTTKEKRKWPANLLVPLWSGDMEVSFKRRQYRPRGAPTFRTFAVVSSEDRAEDPERARHNHQS